MTTVLREGSPDWICEAVGGAFDVISPAGGGTTLLIEIPV
jgi:hypothetical protein